MRSPRGAHTVVALLLAMAPSSGCSFFVQGPPDDYRPDSDGAPACNRCARGTLTLDAIGAIFGASLAVETGDDWSDERNNGRGWVVVGVIGAAIHTGAFLYGWNRTARCREAQDRFIVWAQIDQVPVRQVPVIPLPPPPLPKSCEELRQQAAIEPDVQKRFELQREVRARCTRSAPGTYRPRAPSAN